MLGSLRSAWRALTTRKRPVVTFDETGVACHRSDGTSEEVTWEELTAVEIMTTDTGPFVEDVYWILQGADRGCVVPQEAEGCQELSERLQQLPDYNNQAVIDAMCCTSNARFPVWRRGGTPSQPAGPAS